MKSDKKKRIFWLGMHVVLTKTELPRLRALGFEVFNPPYLADVYDQSANLNWDQHQKSTLPEHVFNALSRFNFFYNEIPQYIADILNEYFDAVIVTINPDWLLAIASAFKGKIIYRTYGQPYPLGPELINRRLWKEIISRDNFYFVPFCQESIENEHEWLKERAFIVPYQLTDDVFIHKDRWQTSPHKNMVTVNIPNIANPYYAEKYRQFNDLFPEEYFSILGVQPPGVSQRRVTGTLPRDTQFEYYKSSKAHFYPYTDLVCYLPPIEAMVIGVPVVYMAGSLLHRFFGAYSPGLAQTSAQVKQKLAYLLNDDKGFIDEIIQSQEAVRLRYSPEYVLEIFDNTFQALLSDAPPSQPSYRIDGPFVTLLRPESERKSLSAVDSQKVGRSEGPVRTIWIFNHFNGTISYTNNKAACYEGIPRVVDQLVSALLTTSDYRIVITVAKGSYEAARDFFAEAMRAGRLSLYLMADSPVNLSPERRHVEGPLTGEKKIEWCGAVAAQYHGSPPMVLHATEELGHRFLLAQRVNGDTSADYVIVPHYYHFPEALFLDRPIVMYVPDFFPHLFPGTKFDGDNDKRNAAIGRAIAEKSVRVLTMSGFTASYLPESDLAVVPEKIRRVPIPWLSRGRAGTLDRVTREKYERLLGGKPYLFYPTANRPNKQLPFLVEVYAKLREIHDDLLLVLTTPVPDHSPLSLAATDFKVRNSIISVENATDELLAWLYENSAALCLTSTAEGNFPPQIIEALMARTPIVATKLPTIVELIGDNPDTIQLCLPMNSADYVEKVDLCLSNREAAVRRQEPLRDFIEDWTSVKNLGAALLAALEPPDLVVAPSSSSSVR